MLVSRSIDGGLSWSAPVSLVSNTGAAFNDKETITADPRDSRFVYAVWDRLRPGGDSATMFSRTTDAGATWEPARSSSAPAGRQRSRNLIRVLPDGTLVNMFMQLGGTTRR